MAANRADPLGDFRWEAPEPAWQREFARIARKERAAPFAKAPRWKLPVNPGRTAALVGSSRGMESLCHPTFRENPTRKRPVTLAAPPAFGPRDVIAPRQTPGPGRESHLPAARYRVVNWMGREIQTATGSSPSLAGEKRTWLATRRAASSRASFPEDSLTMRRSTRPSASMWNQI